MTANDYEAVTRVAATASAVAMWLIVGWRGRQLRSLSELWWATLAWAVAAATTVLPALFDSSSRFGGATAVTLASTSTGTWLATRWLTVARYGDFLPWSMRWPTMVALASVAAGSATATPLLPVGQLAVAICAVGLVATAVSVLPRCRGTRRRGVILLSAAGGLTLLASVSGAAVELYGTPAWHPQFAISLLVGAAAMHLLLRPDTSAPESTSSGPAPLEWMWRWLGPTRPPLRQADMGVAYEDMTVELIDRIFELQTLLDPDAPRRAYAAALIGGVPADLARADAMATCLRQALEAERRGAAPRSTYADLSSLSGFGDERGLPDLPAWQLWLAQIAARSN